MPTAAGLKSCPREAFPIATVGGAHLGRKSASLACGATRLSQAQRRICGAAFWPCVNAKRKRCFHFSGTAPWDQLLRKQNENGVFVLTGLARLNQRQPTRGGPKKAGSQPKVGQRLTSAHDEAAQAGGGWGSAHAAHGPSQAPLVSWLAVAGEPSHVVEGRCAGAHQRLEHRIADLRSRTSPLAHGQSSRWCSGRMDSPSAADHAWRRVQILAWDVSAKGFAPATRTPRGAKKGAINESPTNRQGPEAGAQVWIPVNCGAFIFRPDNGAQKV